MDNYLEEEQELNTCCAEKYDPAKDWVDLDVALIYKYKICGMAIANIPANPACAAYYAVYIYMSEVDQPLIIPFDSAEQRDEMYNKIKSELIKR